MEILNARITDVSLSMRDHGCLTYWLSLKIQGGAYCNYGGHCIGHGYLGSDHFDGSPYGLEAMMRIMDVVGVEKWEDLKDKCIRVKSDGWGPIVDEIGNLMEDKWFNQKQFFAEPNDKIRGENTSYNREE